ncbi:hypothetical protein AVEN_251057-1 [Araneus ventricosus]|uniref:Uncharacterized protein n=1 Tax=Araneus ventricosus TaxID=182803 RepID=A0A4Y2DLR5_ARAVE|nr:hypothetical protein AVEN_251057-1 [Araneus ventricosus]
MSGEFSKITIAIDSGKLTKVQSISSIQGEFSMSDGRKRKLRNARLRLQLTKGAQLATGWLQFHGLRTPVTSAESRAEILTSNLPQIIRSRIQSPFLSKTPNFKLPRPARMRRGRKIKSQRFVGLLTAASNRKPRSLCRLIIGRRSEPKGFL